VPLKTTPTRHSMNAVNVNHQYLEGIAQNDFSVLQRIYKETLPEVSKYIKRNSGTFDDAKDVFQEGIIVVFKKVKKGELELTTSFHNYLFSVCRNIWLKKLTKKGRKTVDIDETFDLGFEENYDELFLQSKKWALFHEKFKQLAEECRKVLQMLFDGVSGRDIASKMGYTEDYAKRKKYKCKQGLANKIKNDPTYQQLIDQ